MGSVFNPNSFSNFMGGMDAGGLGGLGNFGGAASGISGAVSAAGGASAAGGGLAAMGMAGPIGMAAGMILSGVQAAQAKRDARDAARVAQGNSLFSNAYDRALNDWYSRRDKSEKRMALENYKQFNTMDQIMPGYKDVYKPAEVGSMPDARDYMAHHRQSKNKVKIDNQNKQALDTLGSVNIPGG